MIEYTCPVCNEPMRAPTGMADEVEPCPKCGTLLAVPDTSGKRPLIHIPPGRSVANLPPSAIPVSDRFRPSWQTGDKLIPPRIAGLGMGASMCRVLAGLYFAVGALVFGLAIFSSSRSGSFEVAAVGVGILLGGVVLGGLFLGMAGVLDGKTWLACRAGPRDTQE